MGVGTSMGAYYDDSFHHAAASWDSKYDNNVMEPDTVPDATSSDKIFVNPESDPINKTPDFITEVGMKSPMPFPNNRNPDQDFNSRFGNLPPSGILNDIKPQNPDKPLVRKIGYIGELSFGDDLSYDRSEVGENKPMSPAEAKERSKNLPAGEESYTLPGNPYLWIRKKPDSDKSESVPMS